MKKISDWAAQIFIISVAILCAVSILGIWNVLAHDVISKSFQTLWLIALVTMVVIAAARFLDHRAAAAAPNQAPDVPNPIFSQIRKTTLMLLIAAVSLLALLGVMAIWSVLTGDILSKSLASIAVIGFSALVVVVLCLEREKSGAQANISLGGIFVFLVIGWMAFSISNLFWRPVYNTSYNSSMGNSAVYQQQPDSATDSYKVTISPASGATTTSLSLAATEQSASSRWVVIRFSIKAPSMNYGIDYGDGASQWLSGGPNAGTSKCASDPSGLCSVTLVHTYAPTSTPMTYTATLTDGAKAAKSISITVSR